MTSTDIHIRIPQELLEELRRLAEAEDRSVNGTIVRLLRQAMAKGAKR